MTKITIIHSHNGNLGKYIEIRRYDSEKEVTVELANLIHECLEGNASYAESDIMLNRDLLRNKLTLIIIGEPKDSSGLEGALEMMNTFRLDD